MSLESIERVTIVGTGLLGGSLGLALRAGGFGGEIVGVGRRQETLDAAIGAGCMDRGTLDLEAGIEGAGLVVLATPVSAILRHLEQMGGKLGAEVVVTDVGSTKRTIVQTAERVMKFPGKFVGSHPMAGGEMHGPSAAVVDLFVGKPVVLTPTEQTDAEALKLVQEMWAGLGMIVRKIDCESHDLTVARISHLPHAIAVLLVLLAEKGESLSVASTGFAGVTRVAAGDPEIWADIFLDNRDGVLGSLDEFGAMIEGFRKTIEAGDRAGLIKTLEGAKKIRNEWVTGFHPKRTPE